MEDLHEDMEDLHGDMEDLLDRDMEDLRGDVEDLQFCMHMEDLHGDVEDLHGDEVKERKNKEKRTNYIYAYSSVSLPPNYRRT